MRNPSPQKLWPCALLLAFVLAASAYDYKPPNVPAAGHADKYPQHETHKDEGVTVAIEPYGPERTRSST
jgi:hypothetical protein